MQEVEIQLSNGTSFTIFTDVGDMLENAIINWEARTNNLTAQSLCNYINSKGLHKATVKRPVNFNVVMSTVATVLKGITNSLPMPYNIGVLLAAVNDLSDVPYTGVYQENGELLGGDKNALQWKEFLNKPVKVGNISI